jgi:putative FmdB family regulatory protein
MPIYDYECKVCEVIFDKLVKFDDPTPNCPECGSDNVQKKEIQTINFELKGVGIYKNGTN